METIELAQLQERLGVQFENPGWLVLALTYDPGGLDRSPIGYRRLSFIGHAVIDLVVKEAILESPGLERGAAGDRFNAMTGKRMLAQLSDYYWLPSHLQVDEEDQGLVDDLPYSERLKLTANLLEAVVGAIFYDRGYDAARSYVRHELLPQLQRATRHLGPHPKTVLEGRIRSRLGRPPSYHRIAQQSAEAKPALARFEPYTAGVFVGSDKLAEATAPNRPEAERQAAISALSQLDMQAG
jgi:ribonuclease III